MRFGYGRTRMSSHCITIFRAAPFVFSGLALYAWLVYKSAQKLREKRSCRNLRERREQFRMFVPPLVGFSTPVFRAPFQRKNSADVYVRHTLLPIAGNQRRMICYCSSTKFGLTALENSASSQALWLPRPGS